MITFKKKTNPTNFSWKRIISVKFHEIVNNDVLKKKKKIMYSLVSNFGSFYPPKTCCISLLIVLLKNLRTFQSIHILKRFFCFFEKKNNYIDFWKIHSLPPFPKVLIWNLCFYLGFCVQNTTNLHTITPWQIFSFLRKKISLKNIWSFYMARPVWL